MIDYIKISTRLENATHICDNLERFNLVQGVNLSTGQVCYPIRGHYGEMKIEINSKFIIIFGSLHKYYNRRLEGASQNYNDFDIEQIRNAIQWLCEDFGLESQDWELNNLEFGVNINLDQSPTDFLEDNLILMNNKEPKIEHFNQKGHFREFEFSQYYFKIYDKGRQYSLDRALLRVEVKTRKSAFVTKGDRWTLDDLGTEEKLTLLQHKLIECAGKMLICDTFEESYIFEDDLLRLRSYINPKYWIKLNKEVSKSTYSRRKKDFRRLKAMYGLDSMEDEISIGIANKARELICGKELHYTLW